MSLTAGAGTRCMSLLSSSPSLKAVKEKTRMSVPVDSELIFLPMPIKIGEDSMGRRVHWAAHGTASQDIKTQPQINHYLKDV
jgi:hypothetical protein